jgi:hypothetical protein
MLDRSWDTAIGINLKEGIMNTIEKNKYLILIGLNAWLYCHPTSFFAFALAGVFTIIGVGILTDKHFSTENV